MKLIYKQQRKRICSNIPCRPLPCFTPSARTSPKEPVLWHGDGLMGAKLVVNCKPATALALARLSINKTKHPFGPSGHRARWWSGKAGYEPECSLSDADPEWLYYAHGTRSETDSYRTENQSSFYYKRPRTPPFHEEQSRNTEELPGSPVMEDLPDELLADVLGRLAPCGLAVCRRVCTAWRAVVDAHRLLRADLLPLSTGGLFIGLSREPAPPELFAPQGMGLNRIASRLQDYVVMDYTFDMPHVIGSCNGLLLLEGRVVNPATRRWTRLPPCPALPEGTSNFGMDNPYLAFDPVVSPHYEVVLMKDCFDYDRTLLTNSEWPPSPYTMCAYSSETGAWKERSFVREGGPACTLPAVMEAPEPEYRHCAYWRGALYVHCKSDFIMRVNLSNDTYRVIKLPPGINAGKYCELHLGKSKDWVYCAFLPGPYHLRVLFLNESRDEAEWVLKHDIALEAAVVQLSRGHGCRINKHWILHGGNLDEDNSEGHTIQEDSGWDSDNDNVLDIEDKAGKWHCGYGYIYKIFGFHPYKETVFLFLSNERVMACHLDSPKVQDLGPLNVPYRGDVIDTAFVYMPCRFGELS